jgi:hypothetical protein
MNTFKKLAMRTAAVTAAFAIAFTFMVSTSNEVESATTTMTAGAGIDDALTSSSVPAAATLAAVGAAGMTAVTVGQILELTLSAGTNVIEANVAVTDVNVIQAANGGTPGNLAACTAVTSSNTNRTISCAIPATSLSTGSGAGTGAISLALTSTGGGNEIILPLQATTVGSLGATIHAEASDTVTALANITLIAPTIALSVASIKADGVSSTNVTFGSSADTTTGGDTVTIVTDAGLFFKGDDASGGSDLLVDSAQWSPNPAVTGGVTHSFTLAAATDASEADDTISLRSTATGTGTLKVYITPKGGGSAVLIKQLAVTFTAATAAAALTTVSLGTPSPSAIPGAGGTLSRLTVNLKDQNAALIASGKTVTVTTSEGVIDSNGTTCDTASPGSKTSGSDASCTFTWSGAQANLTLWGIGNTGSATITVKATPFGTTTAITSTKSVTLTGGSASSLTLGLFNSTSSTSAPAAYVIKNVTDTAGADNTSDEIVAVAQALDANGNYIIPAGNVTFALTNSAGTAVNSIWANALEDTSIQSGSACSVSISTITGKCVDTIEANAKLKKSGAIGLLDVDKASTAPLAAGTYTVTATHGTGASKKTATATFTVGAAVSTITIADIAATTVGGSTTITATAKDAAGNLVADGTQIAISSAASSMLVKTSTGTVGSTVTVGTSNGVVTVTGLALASGTAQVFATSGTKVGSALSSVTGGEADGTLDKNIPAGGSGSVYWSGGSGIVASATAGGCDALTIAGDNSAFSGKVVYVVGAAFASVNADFDALYTIGSLTKGAYELTCKSAS